MIAMHIAKQSAVGVVNFGFLMHMQGNKVL
jgi:hypothetical protein